MDRGEEKISTINSHRHITSHHITQYITVASQEPTKKEPETSV